MQINKVIRNSTGILCAGIIFYIIYARLNLIFSYSIDLDGAEFTFIHFVQLLLAGKPLYRDPCAFPFLAVMYAPLYPYILYWFSRVLGYTPGTDPHLLYVLARMLAFVFAFINLYIIGGVLRTLKFSFSSVLIAITFYLLFITGHFYVARPDAIKLTVFSLFVFALLKYLFYNGSRIYAILIVCSGLIAVLLKQDALLYTFLLLGAAVAYLRDRRTVTLLIWFTVGLTGMVTALPFIEGNYFFDNTFLFNFQITTDVSKTFNTVAVLFSIARSLPLLLIVLYGGYQAIKKFHDKRVEHYMAIVALLSYGVAHLAMFRAGAYFNYTFESILLMIIASSLVIRFNQGLITGKIKLLQGGMVIYMVLLFVLSILLQGIRFDKQKELQHLRNYGAALLEKKEVLNIIQRDTVFFLNPKYLVFYPEANLIYGYEMHFDRLVEILNGLKSKTQLLFIDAGEYDTYFAEGKVKFIIAENNKESKAGMKRYYPHYSIFRSFDDLVVYKYNLNSDQGN